MPLQPGIATFPEDFVFAGKWLEAPLGYWEPNPNVSFAATVIGNGTIQIAPIQLQVSASFSAVDLFVSNSYSATNAGSSRADTLNLSFGLYQKSASSLILAQSASTSYAFTVTGSSSSASYQGLKQIQLPVSLNMAPGNYWYALASSVSTAGNAVAGALSNIVASYAGGQSAYSGIFGQASAATEQHVLGFGSYSVTSASLPTSIGFSEILGSALGNTAKPIVNFRNFSV